MAIKIKQKRPKSGNVTKVSECLWLRGGLLLIILVLIIHMNDIFLHMRANLVPRVLLFELSDEIEDFLVRFPQVSDVNGGEVLRSFRLIVVEIRLHYVHYQCIAHYRRQVSGCVLLAT